MGLKDIAMKVARKGLRAVRSVTDSPERLRVQASALEEHVASVRPSAGASRHILIASTGVKNIGDQAMVESFIGNVGGPIDVIITSKSTYVLPDDSAGRVNFVVMDSLVYGNGAKQREDLDRFAELMLSARSVSVVGADIIDGGYQLRAPMQSWAIAAGAARAGYDVRVLGFSWGETVVPVITDAAKHAAQVGVTLLPRDVDSARRLRASGVAPIVEALDMVFALPGADADSDALTEIVKPLQASGKKLLLMNISGLIASRVDLTQDYLEVARAAHERGLSIVLLPHVDNRGGSDIEAVKRVGELLTREGLDPKLVLSLLRPLQVRALARLADVVVTGRMHLSILSLSVDTPAVVLSTQGKVSGLMERIGHPEWCIDPHQGMATEMIAALDGALAVAAGAESSLSDGLAADGRKNFVGLE